MGCPNFTFPKFDPTPVGGIFCSMFYPDQALCQGHPRFRYITLIMHMIIKELKQLGVPHSVWHPYEATVGKRTNIPSLISYKIIKAEL